MDIAGKRSRKKIHHLNFMFLIKKGFKIYDVAFTQNMLAILNNT